MKKLILFLSFICIIFTSESQIKDSATLTATKIYEDMKAGINGLAKSLKEPAEHIYNVMIKQQIVNSITYIILIFLAVILIFILIKIAAKNINKTMNKEHNWHKDSWGDHASIMVPLIIGIILSIVTIIGSLSIISNITTGLLNPEYGAMKDILSFIK